MKRTLSLFGIMFVVWGSMLLLLATVLTFVARIALDSSFAMRALGGILKVIIAAFLAILWLWGWWKLTLAYYKRSSRLLQRHQLS